MISPGYENSRGKWSGNFLHQMCGATTASVMYGGVSRLYDVCYHYTEYLHGDRLYTLAAFILLNW
jgi:hypothetical protein